jgi:CDP-diacylglycerol--glycerol-3-phosphate 3-phosphatidyltransferase
MSQIPNLITSVRLLAAIALLYAGLTGQLSLFLPLVLSAGISDMLDGYVARKFNWCTQFGAHLDSISDLLIYIAVLVFLAINQPTEMAQCRWLLTVGAATQILHLILAVKKLGTFPSYHTDFSRFSAYVIYIGIMIFWLFKPPLILNFLALFWIICSLEGIVITAILSRAKSNIPNISACLKFESSRA